MNGNNSMTETPVSERLSDSKRLSIQWKTIDWKKAEQEVNRLQVRIVKATQEKKWNTVKRLQYLLTHSFYAKALAVRRVTTNKGKKTAGVDGEIWSTPAMKMRAVMSLTDKGYKARPLRRVYIEKKDKKKKRPLGIPTMYDRAMQAFVRPCIRASGRNNCRHEIVWFQKGALLSGRLRIYFHGIVTQGIARMGIRRRH